jgi:hypothetical protein
METYTPSKKARQNARIIVAQAAMSSLNPSPVETITKICISCIEVDFNGSVSGVQNEAVMGWAVLLVADSLSE